LLHLMAVLMAAASCESGATPAEVVCEGTHYKHLQGIATDGEAIYWSFTRRLVKTDMAGKLLKTGEVQYHHGDLTCHDGKVYVAVGLGGFNRDPGNHDSWVYVYRATDLSFIAKHSVPQVLYGAGGMACHDGRFVVISGLPRTHKQNYVYEYDTEFHFIKCHILPSGYTSLGIQTACYSGGFWWFGCYGGKLLKADEQFRLVGTYKAAGAVGIMEVAKDRFLIGQCFDDNKRGKAYLARPDDTKGLVRVKQNTN